ncbi:MAG: sulfotransferase [Crocosphaera sp.]|nr:sulfotransferase [Crocosphaera sp.]
MILPNFLVIGTAKAGTSSLWYYLNQHPQIYMTPRKETGFFAFEGTNLDFQGPGDQEKDKLPINNLDIYLQQFKYFKNEIAVGEACTDYIYSPKAPERIHHYIPDVKLIAILRNPIDRAFSQFLGNLKRGVEPLNDFSQAIKQEDKRIADNWHYRWHYRERGFYYRQLKPYFDKFDRNQIRIYIYDDWKNKQIQTLRDIYKFINVDTNFIVDTSKKLHTSPKTIPKNKLFNKLLLSPNLLKSSLKLFIPEKIRQKIWSQLNQKNQAKPSLSYKLRQQLINIYREDILQLQDLLEYDLSKWLKIEN